MNGAVLQMFNHGLSAAGMFFLVGVIYERTHTRDLNEFGGLLALLPVYGTILISPPWLRWGCPGWAALLPSSWWYGAPGRSSRRHRLEHDRIILHRCLHPQGAQAGAARTVE